MINTNAMYFMDMVQVVMTAVMKNLLNMTAVMMNLLNVTAVMMNLLNMTAVLKVINKQLCYKLFIKILKK